MDLATNAKKNADTIDSIKNETVSAKNIVSKYSIDELCSAKNKVFKYKVSEDLVRTALSIVGKTMYTIEEADKIVNNFKKKEVK